MKKLPKIKTLEDKLWELCKQIIRLKYPNTCFTCGLENLKGKNLHTGHFIKKRKLPYELKFDLRFLRPQCNKCNLFNNGNEGMYAINLVKTEGVDYLLSLDSEMLFYKFIPELSIPDKRQFLLFKIEEYQTIKERLLDIE